MKLKKLLPELVTGIKENGFDENPKAIQTASIPQIKSGSDLFVFGEEGAGKSTAMVIGVIQQLKAAFEDAPRAMIITTSKEKSYELEELFKKLGRYTDLRVLTVFDNGVIKFQKDLIFDGIDVLIGTPVQITEIIKKGGIPFAAMKMFIVDDAHEFRLEKFPLIHITADKAPKAQFIITADGWHKKFEKLSEEIMRNPKIIKG